ncbi:MAG: DUF4249 domain-containing protein [Prevotellaceae bacterium]|jgi:hypothetical protein|nr:DUF4249 domain-containing protein [Prevotellaceae bacterium]
MTRYLLAFTILIASLLSSCVEPFDIKTNNSPSVIVIYGYLTDEPVHHTIMVSASSPYFDILPNPGISGASVKITSSENEVFNFDENDTVPGLYQTVNRVSATPGATYSLSVEVDFDNDGVKEIYTATSTMQSPVPIDSIQVKSMEIMGYKFYSLNLYAQDPPSEDYYLGHYKLNDTAILFNISRLSPMSDIGFNGQYINGLMIQRFWDENERENDDDDDDGDDSTYRHIYLSQGDTITFSLSRIEKGYYDFIIQCQDEMRGESPFFGGPASNIATNISNGGLGYFTSYAFSTIKTVVNEKNN